MTGKEFILTSEHFSGEITFKYNLKGYLREAKIGNGVKGLTKEMFEWLWRNLPTTEAEIEEYKKKASNFTITEVPVDLSFERFWKDYGYKVGKKKMTENQWNKLKQKEQIAALLYIPILRSQKKLDGTQMPYPSTYINQKYWEV